MEWIQVDGMWEGVWGGVRRQDRFRMGWDLVMGWIRWIDRLAVAAGANPGQLSPDPGYIQEDSALL